MTPKQRKILCAARVHCEPCRTSTHQRSVLGMPDECPEGFTADNLPEIPGQPAWLTEREQVCTRRCPVTDCAMHRKTQCQRSALLRREAFHCPAGRF